MLFISPMIAKAQTSGMDDFMLFVTKNYKAPDEIKKNCVWAYAVIKVKADQHNKIVSYNFIAAAPDTLKSTFKFLEGYQFKKELILKNRPIVFYVLINNSESCTPKSTDLVYYPNDIIKQVNITLAKIREDDPKSIFINTPIEIMLYPTMKRN